MTHIVLAFVWLTATGVTQRATVVVRQPAYVSAKSECGDVANHLRRFLLENGVIPARRPASFSFSCTTEI